MLNVKLSVVKISNIIELWNAFFNVVKSTILAMIHLKILCNYLENFTIKWRFFDVAKKQFFSSYFCSLFNLKFRDIVIDVLITFRIWIVVILTSIIYAKKFFFVSNREFSRELKKKSRLIKKICFRIFIDTIIWVYDEIINCCNDLITRSILNSRDAIFNLIVISQLSIVKNCFFSSIIIFFDTMTFISINILIDKSFIKCISR